MSTQSRPQLLITRPLAQARQFADALALAKPEAWDPVIAPLIEIIFLKKDPPLDDLTALLFTSANGVEAFAKNALQRGIPAICAGHAATKAAISHGFQTRTLGLTAKGLGDFLVTDTRPDNDQYLHICGVHQTGNLSESLSRRGVSTDTCVMYDQLFVPLPAPVLGALEQGAIMAVTLFSPRTAHQFLAETSEITLPDNLRLLCISRAVAEIVEHLHVCIEIAEKPNQEAMIGLL